MIIAGRHFCIVLAEVAHAYDGSLGMAHAFIGAIENARADAVKFQTHIADTENNHAEPWRVMFSPQDSTRYDYWTQYLLAWWASGE